MYASNLYHRYIFVLEPLLKFQLHPLTKEVWGDGETKRFESLWKFQKLEQPLKRVQNLKN